MDFRPRKRRGVVADSVGQILNNITAAHITRMGNMEIRAVVTMRAMCSTISEGKSKLPTDGDVSRALKGGIKKGVQGCKSVGDQLSTVGFEGFNEHETQILERILKTARVIVELGGSRHRSMCETYSKEGNADGESSQYAYESKESLLDFPSIMKVENENGFAPQQIPWPISGKISLDWLLCLMKNLKILVMRNFPAEFPAVIPFVVVDELIERASVLLQNEPNCVDIHCDTDSHVIVIGNLHGQYLDFLKILEIVGLPSSKRVMIFNGGYVNKGPSSLELLLVLLAWKVFLPDHVYLLRGNDETKGVSRGNGFSDEMKIKFPESGQNLYRKFLGVFAKFPLASLVGKMVYTTHGGLFRSDGIDDKSKVKGKKQRKMKVENDSKTTLSLGSLEDLSRVNRFLQDPGAKDAILRDVLWSNPTPKLGFMEDDKHDAGVLWGPDCTETFLRKNNIKLILRSHESPDVRPDLVNGYSVDHEVESGKLCTLFSAPNFPHRGGKKTYQNKGAIAVLKPTDFSSPEFILFEDVEWPKVRLDDDVDGGSFGGLSNAKRVDLDTEENVLGEDYCSKMVLMDVDNYHNVEDSLN